MSSMLMKPETEEFKKHYCYVDKFNVPMSIIENTVKYREYETGGMMILAPSGSGKSSIASKFIEDNKFKPVSNRDIKFGIYVEASGCSLDEFLTEILRQLSDPKPSYGNMGPKVSRIISLIDSLNVRVVFLDEIQVILPTTGIYPNSKVVKILKELVNKTSAAWVLIGDPSARSIIDIDSQIRERFGLIHNLEPFNCKSDEDVYELLEYTFELLRKYPRKSSYFRVLNNYLDEGVKPIKSNRHEDHLYRFCLATLGKPRLMRDLLCEAIELTDEDAQVTNRILQNAWTRRVGERSGLSFNPFVASMEKVKIEMTARNLYG
ncbi:AAA family ATPase [Thalassomonas sp. M1454]|nr:AAA family ATPase [Thalassomonas sp. M1454]